MELLPGHLSLEGAIELFPDTRERMHQHAHRLSVVVVGLASYASGAVPISDRQTSGLHPLIGHQPHSALKGCCTSTS